MPHRENDGVVVACCRALSCRVTAVPCRVTTVPCRTV
ncbi:unnamed protein product [Arabidopsis halleri]